VISFWAVYYLHLPFRGNSFDLVFNAGVIEHFINHLAPLKEMIRVTKTGRYVVTFVINRALDDNR